MKTRYLYIIVITALLFTHCKKSHPDFVDNPYGLPNASQNGTGVFACRINGQKRIAKNNLFFQGGRITADSVTVFASFGDVHYYENIAIIVYGRVRTETPYEFIDSTSTRIYYATDSSCMGIPSPVSNSDKANGTIIFSKLDSVHKIVSGNFSFDMPFDGCDSLHFTDGRFDIGY